MPKQEGIPGDSGTREPYTREHFIRDSEKLTYKNSREDFREIPDDQLDEVRDFVVKSEEMVIVRAQQRIKAINDEVESRKRK